MASQHLIAIVKSFDKLKVETLRDTLTAFNKEAPTNAKKVELMSRIKTLVLSNTFTFVCDSESLAAVFLTDLKIASSKLLLEHLEKSGDLAKTLDTLSNEAIDNMINTLSLTDETFTNRTEKSSRIEEECLLQGVNKMIHLLTPALLNAYLTEHKITPKNDNERDAKEIMRVMFDLGDEEEEEEAAAATTTTTTNGTKEPTSPSKKKAPAKKPGKPAAKPKAKAAPKAKEPAKPKATPSPKKPATPKKSAEAGTEPVSPGKRARVPVVHYGEDQESEDETTTPTKSKANGKKAAAASPKTSKRKSDDIEGGPSNPMNELGGYMENGKYVDPPLSKLTKNLSPATVNNCFNVETLRQFAKDSNIPGASAKKQILIKKILAHLNGEPIDSQKKPKAAKKGKGKKQTPKKQKTDTTSTTATTGADSTTTDTTA